MTANHRRRLARLETRNPPPWRVVEFYFGDPAPVAKPGERIIAVTNFGDRPAAT